MKKIQAILYKFIEGELFCLCVKRSIQDGDFWHVVVGTVENIELDEDCLSREVKEELGGNLEIISISPILKKWVWQKGQDNIDMVDYAVEVSDGEIILNEEHTEYIWLKPEEAFLKYKYPSGKEMIKLLDSYLAK